MTMPRHVALLSTDFRPMVGGVADHLHRLADAMAARVPVTVLTSAPANGSAWAHAYRLQALPPPPERRLHAAMGDRFAPMRRLRTGAHFLELRTYGNRTIARVATEWDRHAAVVIGIWDMAGHSWCSACRRVGIPYYLFVHGAEIVMPLYGRLPLWRATDFREASGVIANSAATAQLAVDRLQLTTPPVVVNPSVGPRPAAEAIARRAAELRAQFGLQDGLTLFSLGRLVPRKGFDLAVEGVAAIAGEFPGVSYLIAGDGPERHRLESLVNDLKLSGRVHVLGTVDEVTKWAAYDACDVFVMPNRLLGGADWEGFGIVFLEAALSGRPSIAGRTGGAREAVLDEVTGVLVDPESPGELPNALRRLLTDRRLREALGRAGLDRARTQFTPDAAAERLQAQVGWS